MDEKQKTNRIFEMYFSEIDPWSSLIKREVGEDYYLIAFPRKLETKRSLQKFTPGRYVKLAICKNGNLSWKRLKVEKEDDKTFVDLDGIKIFDTDFQK